MNIVMFETETWEVAACQRLAGDHKVRCVPESLSPANAADFADAEVISTFINSKLDAKTLKSLTKLRLIATRSTGFDHIDMVACRAAGVEVCNVPNYGDPTVAEYAFAMLLALSRRVPDAVERARRGDFSQSGLRGFDLAGKVFGVVGTGHIGQRAIQIAKGFGMTVVAFDARPDKDLEARLGMRFVTLNQLLNTSDVVSLHVPGGPGTRDLISAEGLALMKPSAVIINTARGDVIDTEALLRALADDRLAGAALDVFSQEPWLRDEAEMFRPNAELANAGLRMLAADHALIASPKVVASAHVAYDTQEAVVRILDITLANIVAFEAGAPQNRVGAPAEHQQGLPEHPHIAGRRQQADDARPAPGFTAAIAPLIEEVVRGRADLLHEPTPARVHALRGALRRTRACILLFETLLAGKDCAWIRRELDRFIRQLGPVRDLDVLILRRADRGATDSTLAAPDPNLDIAARSAREAAAARAQRQARAARTTIVIEGLRAWLGGQTCAANGPLLVTHMVEWLLIADAKVRKAGDRDVGRGKQARHRLRGRLKTLRYNTEVFLRLHDQSSDGAYVAVLDELHILLGDMNDDAVGIRLERTLTMSLRNAVHPDGHRSRSKALRSAWRRFEALEPPWAGGAAAKAA